MGDNAYYICKSIEHFLSDFPNRSSQPSYNLATSAPDLKEDFSPTQNCLLVNYSATELPEHLKSGGIPPFFRVRP